MFDIAVEEEIAAAHQLRGYHGKCEKLHGHNLKVRLEVTCEHLDEIGLGIDFTDLRRCLKNILEGYDHVLLNELPEFAACNPTSENLACLLFKQCRAALNEYPVRMKAVTIWESSKSFVRYYE